MSEPITQSAVERRSAKAEIDRLVARFSPAHEKLVGTARRWLQKRLPTAYEVVYEYRDCFVISCSPNDHGYDGVLAIRGDADGVKLYFTRAKSLSASTKMLKGSAQARWLEIESAATLARPEVTALVDTAIASTSAPFAISGRGP